MARRKTSFLDTPPVESDDFGDLGPVIAADEKPVEAVQEVAMVSPLKLSPKPVEVTLKPEEILAAVTHGDSSGLPFREGFDPVQSGREIVIAQDSSKITAGIAGHLVDCVLIHEVRLSSWKVRGKAQELSGKYRLENEVRIVLNGQVLILKRGKEFYDHQIPIVIVQQAGGIVLPIGTQE